MALPNSAEWKPPSERGSSIVSSNTKGGKAGTTLSNMSDGNELSKLGDAKPQAREELVRRRLPDEGNTAELLGKDSALGRCSAACSDDG